MSKDKIKKSAVKYFIEQGYDGTSLAKIAEDVQMKKQSIYAHFKSKDDLYLSVVQDVIDQEAGYLNTYFQGEAGDIREFLAGFIEDVFNRYMDEENTDVSFLMRLAYMPPRHLKEQVIEDCNNYFLLMEKLVEGIFLQDEKYHGSSREAALSFMTIFDGLITALIYGGEERFQVKFDAVFKIYWRGTENL